MCTIRVSCILLGCHVGMYEILCLLLFRITLLVFVIFFSLLCVQYAHQIQFFHFRSLCTLTSV
jgi:hypothetical protein